MNNIPEYNSPLTSKDTQSAASRTGIKAAKGIVLAVVIVLAAAAVTACVLFTRLVSVENGRWLVDLTYEDNAREKAEWVGRHFPDLDVRYPVSLGGMDVASDSAVLTLTDGQGVTAGKLIEAAGELTGVRFLNLTGLTLTTGEYLQLCAAYPEAEIRWMVPVNGITIAPETAEVQLGSLEELRELCAVAEYLPQLKHIDLVGAELNDSQLAEVSATAQQLAGQGIELTWEIMIAGRFYAHTTSEVAFVGDYDADDLAQLHRLPNLTSLVLDGLSITDLSPVTALTTLESLTVRNMSVDDVMVLADMHWLGSFYAVNTTIPQWQLDALQQRLPECIIMTIQ